MAKNKKVSQREHELLLKIINLPQNRKQMSTLISILKRNGARKDYIMMALRQYMSLS